MQNGNENNMSWENQAELIISLSAGSMKSLRSPGFTSLQGIACFIMLSLSIHSLTVGAIISSCCRQSRLILTVPLAYLTEFDALELCAKPSSIPFLLFNYLPI